MDPLETTHTLVVIGRFREAFIYTQFFEGYKMFHMKANDILIISFEYNFTPASAFMNKEGIIKFYSNNITLSFVSA